MRSKSRLSAPQRISKFTGVKHLNAKQLVEKIIRLKSLRAQIYEEIYYEERRLWSEGNIFNNNHYVLLSTLCAVLCGIRGTVEA